MVNVALWMGWRYLFAGSRGYSAFVNWVSVVGLALGMMLFIVISSVHNGLTELTKDRLLKSIPHALIPPELASADLLADLAEHPNVREIVDYFEGLALVQGQGESKRVVLIGHSGLASEELRQALVESTGSDAHKGLVLSSVSSGVIKVGDAVLLVLLSAKDGHVQPAIRRVPLTGTFEFKSQADYINAFISLEELEKLNVIDPSKYRKRLYLKDPFLAAELDRKFPDVEVWSETYGELFRVYQLEKIVLYCLMFLVILLAAFNIVSGQAMLINSKRTEIAILRTLGAPTHLMLRVAAVQGMLVAVLGIVSGVLLGILLALNAGYLFDMIDEALGIPLLQGTAFSSLPSDIQVVDVVIGVVVAFGLAAIAIIQPVWDLMQMNPVDELN